MVPRRLTWLFVMVLCGSQACGYDPPTAPSPTPAVPPSQPTTVTVPEIRGVVLEVDGGPIAGATVDRSSPKAGFVTTRSDANGLFMFPASLELSGVNLFTYLGSWGERYVWGDSVAVSPSTDPAPVSVQIRLQPTLTVSDAQALDTTLSPDDLRFSYVAQGVACGPCKVILLKPSPGGTGQVDVRIHASTAGPLQLALVKTPLSYYFDEELIGQASSPSSDLTYRIERGQLDTTPSFVMALYVWRPTGPLPASIHVSLVRVQ